MGVIQRILNVFQEPSRGKAKDDFESGKWYDAFLGDLSSSGVRITKENALALSGVYAAVTVYTNAVSSMPIHIIRADGEKRIKDKSHPNYKLLSREPNQLMTSFVWRQIIIPHILLWGNAYCLIEFKKGGNYRPKSIMPIHPSNIVEVKIEKGVLMYYIVLDDGAKIKADQYQMLHFRGKGNNVMGQSVIDHAKDSLGAAKATENFGSSFFKNGANTNGVLSTDQTLNDKSFERLSKSWNSRHSGSSNSHKTAILEAGLKYQQISIPPDSAQFLETKRFSIEDIARWFTLPPHMIADLSHATFTNIDAQDLNLVKHSLLPLVTNIEQELHRKLFREQEKDTVYPEMNMEGLLRGDIKTRYEAYKIGIQNGFVNANEARAKESMNPYKGGNTYWMQTNTAPIDEEGSNQNFLKPEKNENTDKETE